LKFSLLLLMLGAKLRLTGLASKEFRKLLNELMGNEEALAKMLEQLKGYESMKLPLSGK